MHLSTWQRTSTKTTIGVLTFIGVPLAGSDCVIPLTFQAHARLCRLTCPMLFRRTQNGRACPPKIWSSGEMPGLEQSGERGKRYLWLPFPAAIMAWNHRDAHACYLTYLGYRLLRYKRGIVWVNDGLNFAIQNRRASVYHWHGTRNKASPARQALLQLSPA